MFNLLKRLMFVSLIIFAVLSMVGCRCQNYVQTPAAISADSKTNRETQKQFLAAAERLAKETGDQEAIEISEFLNSNIVTVMDVGTQLKPVGDVPAERPVPLLIVSEENLSGSDDISDFTRNENIFGVTKPFASYPLIIIKNRKLSRLSSALLILHMGCHAKSYYSYPKKVRAMVSLETVEEEVRILEFEMRLLDKVGGTKYADLVNEQVSKYLETDLPMSEEEAAALEKHQRAALIDIFGDFSAADQRYFWTRFVLETKFREFDLFLPDKKYTSGLKELTYQEMVEGDF